MITKEQFNTRVLIIDDEEMVRDNIEEILVPKETKKDAQLDAAADLLFGGDTATESSADVRRKHFPYFFVDKAVNGKQGLEMVKAAHQANQPYAVIFLDMRMPGWDGLKTAHQIRKIDTLAEIIIVTAGSDHSIDQIVAQAGKNVG
jgi:CheY-like chemotaxis protein